MKRKIYNQLLEWKINRKGDVALLIEGARRIGKSYIVEEFARNEYTSYILIDFNKVGTKVKRLFDEYLDDLKDDIELDDGLPGVILFFDREKADDVWIALFNTPGVWTAGLGAWDLLRLNQILPPYNTVNCQLPLLLCRWDGRKYPSKLAKVEWNAKNAFRQSQVLYASVFPDTDEMFLLFSGEFEVNATVKMRENAEESIRISAAH